MKKLKRILSNKNTVTFIGIILIVLVLYIFYNWRVNMATTPIRVPYAVQNIPPRTKITRDMIGYVEINQPAIKGNIYTNLETQIIQKNMYTNVNCMIPAGSLLYTSALVREEELPDAFLVNLKEGDIAYNFDVSMKTTYGNSMYPGNYVDIYFRYEDDNGVKKIGKLLENVEILAVKDSSGRAVFENISEERSPAQIIFGVTDEIHYLLRKAEYITRDAKENIILVPTNASLELEEGETAPLNVTSETIKQYIESKAETAQ